MAAYYREVGAHPRQPAQTLGSALNSYCNRWIGGSRTEEEKLRKQVHNLQQVLQAIISYLPKTEQRAVMYQLGFEVDDGH